MLVTGDLEVAVAPSVVLTDASILWGIRCPSGAGKQLEGMNGLLVI
jgi:hypothetical protein